MTTELARKYRPHRFEDVCGQEIPVRVISNALSHNQLHRSYLFVGAFGTGKTTMARILAASENCLVSPGLSPCGKCDACLKIFQGVHPDVLEVDAASSAGSVAEIRRLKGDALSRPIALKTKYFILDEAHRMSSEAKDALLKIVEEPPAHVRFVLCTTDVNSVSGAIQSRCQRHDFRLIFHTKIADRLAVVAKHEKLSIDESALQICARYAYGSMRTALQNLEKLVSYAQGENITSVQASELLAGANENLYFQLMNAIVGEKEKPDATEAYRIVNQLVAQTENSTIVVQNLEEHLRHLLLCLSCSKALEFINLSPNAINLLKQQYVLVKGKLPALLKSYEALTAISKAMEYNFALEGALLSWIVKSIHLFKGG